MDWTGSAEVRLRTAEGIPFVRVVWTTVTRPCRDSSLLSAGGRS